MLCVHLFKQRLRLFADLIVRVFLGLLGTSSRPRSFPHGPPRGWLPPSLHHSCSVLPWGCPALASCHLPPSLLGWVGIYGFTFSYYLCSVLGAFLRKQERIGGETDCLGCSPAHSGSTLPAPAPEAGAPGPSRGLASGFAGNMLSPS